MTALWSRLPLFHNYYEMRVCVCVLVVCKPWCKSVRIAHKTHSCNYSSLLVKTLDGTEEKKKYTGGRKKRRERETLFLLLFVLCLDGERRVIKKKTKKKHVFQ